MSSGMLERDVVLDLQVCTIRGVRLQRFDIVCVSSPTVMQGLATYNSRVNATSSQASFTTVQWCRLF